MKPIYLHFPNISGNHCLITSAETPAYNCIAWAADDISRWWWPASAGYWPYDVPREVTLDAFERAYATLGYIRCISMGLEKGFEKIAIYSKDGTPTHAARQLRNGYWTSKLGPYKDIEHSLDGLEGNRYGAVSIVMKRPTGDTHP